MSIMQSAELRSEGEDLVLRLTAANGYTSSDPIFGTLALHDDIGIYTVATIRCERKEETWIGRLLGWRPAEKPRVLELVRITDARGELVNMSGAHLFLEPLGDGLWMSGAAADAERARLREWRSARFESPLLGEGAKPTDPIFAVVMLAENLHLTIQQQIPGMRVLPMPQTGLGADVVNVLNSALQQLGFGSFINPGVWIEQMQQRRPAAILYVPKVRASNEQAAGSVCRRTARQLLELLALRRGASPRLLGGVVGVVDNSGITQCVGSWSEGIGYTGNLLGGFISGEDPHGLMLFWDGLSKEPRARLWLSLYADAMAEQRWDYRLFRFFNLLEGVAAEIVPEDADILDSQGAPRLQNGGRPYTTRHARGKVYELLRAVAAKNQEAESNFTACGANGARVELWDEISIWVAVRNAVAHRGSWAPPDGEPQSGAQALVETEIISRGFDNTFASGIWSIEQAISAAVKSTLIAALRGRL